MDGDFNCVVNQNVDKYPPEQRAHTLRSKSLYSVMEDLGLADIWLLKHPDERDCTYFSRVHKSHSRIYLFCVQKQDAHRVDNRHIEPISDHGPVIMSVRLDLEKHF